MRSTAVYVTPFVLVLVFLLMACGQSDKERIRGMNEAASGGQPFDADTLSGTISSFDLRDGDCFNTADTIPEYPLSVTFKEVELVSCSGEWTYRVLNSFVVNRQGAYPGDDYFQEEGALYCHRLMDFLFFPIPKSWELGDRTVSCIQENL